MYRQGRPAESRATACQNTRINKVREGRPHIVDAIKNRQIGLIINTPSGKNPRTDEVAIRTIQEYNADTPGVLP